MRSDIGAGRGLPTATKLHVEDTGGGGRPVVLIHGWPLSGQSWSAQVPVLEGAGYRVITYDRRGFGRSDKPMTGYGYNTLADDLHNLIGDLDLQDVTLVGFSMGGGEVARYCAVHGCERLRSVVFASAITPFMLQTEGNPDGPLSKTDAAAMSAQLAADSDTFYDEFTREFFTAGGELRVTESERQQAIDQCNQASKTAALACMTSFGTTDLRDDIESVTVPALVLHGDSDATVPFEGSGKRTHEAIEGSELYLIEGGPHGCNVSHADEFNRVLLDFLAD